VVQEILKTCDVVIPPFLMEAADRNQFVLRHSSINIPDVERFLKCQYGELKHIFLPNDYIVLPRILCNGNIGYIISIKIYYIINRVYLLNKLCLQHRKIIFKITRGIFKDKLKHIRSI
jgi:hypothetical protein